MRNILKEEWIRWEPKLGLAKNYYCESIVDTPEDGLKIKLFDEQNNQILVTFPNSVDAYRTTDENFVFYTLKYLEKKYGKEFYSNWSFFKITHSDYLKWIKKESGGVFEIYNLQHFCFWTINCRIDVASRAEPGIISTMKKNDLSL